MIMERILLVQLVIIHVLHVMQERVITVIPAQLLEPLRCLIHVLAVLPISSLLMFAHLARFLARLAAFFPQTAPLAQVQAIFQLINASATTAIIQMDSSAPSVMFVAKPVQ